MAKSKIKSFSPIMRDGVHSTWSKDGKTFYNFTLEFENGDKGQASSTHSTPKWGIGKEYTYDISTNEKGYTNIRGLKAADYVPGAGGNRNDPEENKSIAYQVSYQAAIDYMKNKNEPFPFENIPKFAKEFHKLLTVDVEDKRNFITACSALKMTIVVAGSKCALPLVEGGKISSMKDFLMIYSNILNDLRTFGSVGLEQ